MLGLALVAAGGCTGGALHPFHTEATRVADARIEGSWRPEQGKERYEIQPDGEGYTITWTTRSGQRYRVAAFLFEVGSRRYADVIWDGMADPDKGEKSVVDTAVMLAAPLHFCLAVEVKPDGLHVQSFDKDWLEATLRQDPGLVEHAVLEDGRIVLTASTPELQRFLRRIEDLPEAFDKEGILVRAATQAASSEGGTP